MMNILLALLLIVVLSLLYTIISFGPYLSGKRDGQNRTKKEIIELSLNDPAEFELWLRKEQLRATDRYVRILKTTTPRPSPVRKRHSLWSNPLTQH